MVKYIKQMTIKLDRFQAFIEWLNEELDTRDMSDRELARRGGVSQSSISLLRAGQGPGLKTLQAIARGLDVPLSVVLQKAGLDEPIEETASLRNLLHVAAQLPEDDLERLVGIARTLQDQAKREGKLREAKAPS
jgi:transcriptional regulator with XRE-family HTH domain